MLGLALLAGVWFAGDLAVWNTSLGYTSAANSTLLGNTSTLWVSIFSLFVLRERLRGAFWAGAALALVGAAIIVGPDLRAEGTLALGDALALVSSLFYAAYLLTTSRVRRSAGTLEYMWLSSLGAAGVLLVFCLAAGLPLTGYSADTYASTRGARADLARRGLAVHQLRAGPPARLADLGQPARPAGDHGPALRAAAGRGPGPRPDRRRGAGAGRHLPRQPARRPPPEPAVEATGAGEPAV